MKYNEIKKKTKDELIDLLKNLKKESYNLRFQKKNGQLEKTGRMDQVKKDIARIKTKMNDEFLGDKDAKKNIER
ncbi:uncharacterized protein METZ01_LOCUS485905 [marine metagenome]|jgi:large subunit ribosomal protein L29|uniref:Large ribosomal subunit protein uL29 n=1 Tax=marine metagenome TaxID=408172 RepID=A0A383CLR3_9ZZZZ|nr:50S ribosomal protein L29 [Pelagibacteraceae bacterium]|tara:strand:+ start:1626 stop:1847 length:222 start_codon:yes stop_codon:yes gene_type:complete